MRITTVFLFLVLGVTAMAQKQDVLMTIDGAPVYANEFKRVYKKNLNLVQDETQKSVDGYLELFVDYKLKVAEAYAQKFHEAEKYKSDFKKYEEQLSRTYIYEDKVTLDLAREAYERAKEEISASHILIMVGFDAVPQDTLVAYNKIEKIRERALAGEDFTKLAKETSEEPGIDRTGGKLDWFTTFDLVYSFETEAFKTPVGEISDIVRTRFGYHIMKIHDRRMKAPEITVSHIMISAKEEDPGFDPEERIREIYALLQQGETFENLAKQYSDDKNSGKDGGKLRPFSKGDLRSEKFVDAAYGLENPGDVSEPILSEFGWHIIRLEKRHPESSFEEKRAQLEKRVKEGSRSKIVTAAVAQKIKDKFGFEHHNSYAPYFNTFVNDTVLKRIWRYKDDIPQEENRLMFVIGNDKKVYYSDFAWFIHNRQSSSRIYSNKDKLLADYYDEFETNSLKDYFRAYLMRENQEYAGIINEYQDGLLIFEVMGKNVWRKAKKDSVGQETYYKNNIEKYQWKDRVRAEVFTTTSMDAMEEIQKQLQQGNNGADIKKAMNSNQVNVLLSDGVYETDHQELPDGFVPQMGLSKVYQQNTTYTLVNVKEMIPAGPKDLDDCRGSVQSDYQAFIEKQWMEELRSKYQVEINKKTLRKIKKELSST